MIPKDNGHIGLTMISDIFRDYLCIDWSEKGIQDRGVEPFEIGQVVISEITPGDTRKLTFYCFD